MPIINSSLFGSGGTDTSNATATAADILTGKTAYIATGEVIGTMPTKVPRLLHPALPQKRLPPVGISLVRRPSRVMLIW